MKIHNVKYIHDEFTHNFNAAEEIVPYIIELFQPKSVVDIGCGIGNWLNIFKKYGIQSIIGIDGSFVDKRLLKISKNSFIEKDLEQSFVLEDKFDLAISLEVAEHISFEKADVFMESICNLSDLIVFSAAIPNQGGQNHINEQPPLYWIQKFESRGYKMFDIIRPLFWDNEKVDWWYKQNMLVFSKKSVVNQRLDSLDSFYGAHLVHPIVLKNRSFETFRNVNEIKRIESGEKALRFYFEVFKKSIFNRIFNTRHPL